MDSRLARWESAILLLVSLIGLLGSLLLARADHLSLSPDETANAFFIESFARSGTLYTYDPLNESLGDVLFPRSTVAIAGRIVPIGFLGLPIIYGDIVRIMGEWSIPFLTALIAIAAVFAWRAILRRVFEERVAWIGALLLALHPAWIFYTARGLLPNVLFVSLLIFGSAALIVRPFQKKKWEWMNAMTSGLCIGMALFVRASEALWVLTTLLVLTIIFRRAFTWRHLLLFLVGFVVALFPMAGFNQDLYGAPWKTGYTLDAPIYSLSEGSNVVAEVEGVRQKIENILKPVFPFGIHPRAVWRHVRDNAIVMFWWMTIFVVMGAFLIGKTWKKKSLSIRAFTIVALVVSAWLAFMYGSWTFSDHPNPNQITIGNSYARYWLPAFVLMTPFAAMGLQWLSERYASQRFRVIAASLFLMISTVLGVKTAFLYPHDGLVAAAATLQRSVEIRRDLLLAIEPNAIVVTDRGDKLLFPDRRVRVPLRDQTTYELLPRFVEAGPVYYYGITLPSADVMYLMETVLAPKGLQIELVKTYDAESLYRITKK